MQFFVASVFADKWGEKKVGVLMPTLNLFLNDKMNSIVSVLIVVCSFAFDELTNDFHALKTALLFSNFLS